MALGRHPMVDPSRQMMQPRADIPRSAFDVRDFHKTTFGQGALVPIYIQEVLPGDSLRVKMSALVRLATPIVPVMDNLALQSFFFFVPNRLVWDNWEQFISGPSGPGDTTTHLVPQITGIVAADCGPGSLFDYFGIPAPAGANTVVCSALPMRAYTLIYNEWFRDQALQDPVTLSTGDGPDAHNLYGMWQVTKKHDYFTSCRPWPQAASVTQESGNIGPLVPGGRMTLGLTNPQFYGIQAPLHGLSFAQGATPAAGPFNLHEPGGRSVLYSNAYRSSDSAIYMDTGVGTAAGAYPQAGVLVNDLRTAFSIQTIVERQARVGGRYTEFLRGVFGVHPQDSRLQRPEYLGGGRTMVTVNPVAQTSASGATGTTTKLGQLAAAGYVAATDHGFSQSFPEHGYVIGIMCTRSELTYQQGMDRLWSRHSAYDFYRPELAHLGEQAVISREIYQDGSAGDDNVFGYQERWAEYRTRISRTSGYMRSSAATPIDMWHFGEKFASRPSLNYSAFLPDLAPVDRVLQATAPYTAQFMADVMFDSRMVRALPMFSVPGVGARM